MEKEKNLFEQFPPISTQEWEDLIIKDLKGADYEKKLVWKTNERFSVNPFYRADDLDVAYHLSKNGTFNYAKKNADWKIRQDFIVNDVEETNKLIGKAINNGVNSIGIDVSGFEVVTKEVLYKTLSGICPECIEINIICNKQALNVLDLVKEYFEKEKLDADKVHINIEYDPFADFVFEGENCINGIDTLRELILGCSFAPNMRVGVINASAFGNCGSALVEELAFGLNEAADVLDFLTESGLNIDNITKRIKFQYSIGSNYFMEIAKIRAARYLWGKIVEAYKPKENNEMYIHAVTSSWNKTLYDPYVNMLRTTTEAMSSIIGGINSLTVLPFNFITTNNDDFALRIAKNQQILLKEESHFDKVNDPAAGSYYIEFLTNQFIEIAWKQFLSVVEKGGFISCFKENYIQNVISETATKRNTAIATRRENFIGVNQFPNITESIDFELVPEKTEEKEEPSCCCCEDNINTFNTLQPYRGPEAFERLRLKTELYTKQTGKRPRVFLLTYGSLSMRIARAGFASNFFGCIGFEIINNNGFASVEVGITAAKNAEADIVVICSADEEYASIAPQIYKGLKDTSVVVVAGYPKDDMDKLTAAGVTNFIHVKTNVLESLENFQRLIIK
ncbi:MAG: methylmalonyl-CoA mutase family protein [Bacteroidales bacterium]|jgi:methylmalonyl-CoA mutase|nr:methylmalonyl-CoA mutase family protein [Bacteroidales bacterium]MDD2205247.1 methylmalonyl-CoA mutase family protein [Bacteroidales bacterium]MDD3151458.1 methylmalonyl-CoA mutase family protein [Bacteroidales bacterium]MDD3914407.1 methylmalonyl-CoA mutase family protein [Bacteroidales bacterium]MDD4634588.1 methylmalonyl-CoA mutase family protein [Bacteroidales bacterium]